MVNTAVAAYTPQSLMCTSLMFHPCHVSFVLRVSIRRADSKVSSPHVSWVEMFCTGFPASGSHSNAPAGTAWSAFLVFKQQTTASTAAAVAVRIHMHMTSTLSKTTIVHDGSCNRGLAARGRVTCKSYMRALSFVCGCATYKTQTGDLSKPAESGQSVRFVKVSSHS